MALINPSGVEFGDWIAIKDLVPDDSYQVMRYNSDTLKIKVQFQRNNSYPLYWQELYLKYQINFQDMDTTSSKSQSNYDWIKTSFEYEGDTAIASFEIVLNNFSPIESITLWGRRKNDEEDIKEKTYIIENLGDSLKKDIFFNNKHNIESISYENIKSKIWSSAYGSLINGLVTEIKGTSKEQNYLSSSWHNGYIAIKPVKIKYLGKERYAKVSLGESNSSNTAIPYFKEVFSFYPTESKWYYFKLDEETKNIYYPIIKYTIGECDLFHRITDINIKSLLHISLFSSYINPLDNLVRKSQSIIELTQDKDSYGNLRFNKTNNHPIYKITQGPVLSGDFRINFSEEFCYEFEDKKTIDFYIKDYYGNKFDGGKFQYFSNDKILRLHTSPNFFAGRGTYYINEDEEKQKGYIGPTYRDEQCRWDICFKAKNIFSQTEEEITFNLFFDQNNIPIIFKEGVEVYFSTEDFTKDQLLIIDGDTITGFSDKMKLLEPRILNPYEQIGFCFNSDFVYFPRDYTSGQPSSGRCSFLLYESLTNSENEQAFFSTESHICYNPQKRKPFRLNNESGIEATQSYSAINEGKELQEIYTFQDSDKASIKSLKLTQFLKIGIKAIFYLLPSGVFETPITEIATIRMGRVLPMSIKTNSVQLSTQKVVYTLNDYGGDLTAQKEKIYNKENSSLSRTGYEYLEILLIKDNNEKFGSIKIGNDPQKIDIFRGYLLEGIKRTVSNLTLITEKTYESNEELLEDFLKVKSLKGEYHYSYDGKNPYQITTFEIDSFTFLEEGIPPLGIRKGGIIINGEPGIDLESVEGTTKGKYFFDINALDINDRIRITFPGAAIQGEIYYDGEAIVLKGFKLLS